MYKFNANNCNMKKYAPTYSFYCAVFPFAKYPGRHFSTLHVVLLRLGLLIPLLYICYISK